MSDTQQQRRKTVLITGASVGIGYELAKVFGRASYDMILVARNKKRLEIVAEEIQKTYAVRAMIFPKDLTKVRAPKDIFDAIHEHKLEIDVLVNNAGFGSLGMFVDSDLQGQLDMIQLNVKALVDLTGRFLPSMVARGSGKILNIASTAAFQPGPMMATYYATKAFVVSWSEAVAFELKSTGVTLTAFCPGPTDTEFQKRAGTDQIKFYGTAMSMKAGEVARQAYQAMMDGKRTSVAGIKNRVLATAASLMPNAVSNRVVLDLNSKRA